MLQQPEFVEAHTGAPSKLSVEEKKEVWKAFQKYVDEEDYPTVVDFCANNKVADKYDVTRDNLNDWPQFSTLRKKAIQKQEAFTEEQVLKGKLNPTWAIFKLKQPAFGWTDKQQVEHSGDMTINQTFNPAIKDEFEQFLKAKDVIDVTPKQLPSNE